ncbi:GINS complex, Sld5 component [Lentithecium fluviatile CBS 122367]|uniref:DNA replication complex GINS protein SLD5 n=1 Tax=Lentithecium fluviatile CBS 122367 TaxID=1168545 RepID=A0A6G1JD73_9PLEO|nr:GINS complex, Sld5 component [Lentithecium fluviatile CBS 122367]
MKRRRKPSSPIHLSAPPLTVRPPLYFPVAGAMDIDDILADIAVETIPQETRDLQELTRCWVAERVAPEILAWPVELMERVLDRVRRQIELVEDQTGNMDPKTNFKLIVIQTELERFKFLVRSFLRARIAKIDKHPLHILAQHNASLTDPDARNPLLSPSEHQYLTSHQSLLSTHYSSSFLGQFPAALQRLDDTAGGISMVDKPDEDCAVFVRCLRDVGEVAVEGTEKVIRIKRGDVWVVRWCAVRRWVLAGDVELV